MATKTVSVKVVGDASSARKELGSLASETEKVGARAGKAFGALSSLAGASGAFGPLSDVMAKVGEGLDFIAENGRRAGTVMIGVGGTAAAAGVLMTKAAEKNVVAHKQLKVSIENSGHSYEAYEGRVKAAIRSQERFGHTADETQEALRKLTDATGDPAKALAMMGLVADIAASRHISLADAAALVAKILNGTGGKALASYGIHIDKSKDKTQELNRALAELSQKTSGQAAAAADTMSGRFDAMAARVKDTANAIGAKLGPALTFAGTALATLGATIEVGAAAKAAYTAASLRLAASQAAVAASTARITPAMAAATVGTIQYSAAATAAGVSGGRLAASQVKTTTLAGQLSKGLGVATAAAISWYAVNAAGSGASDKWGEQAADVDKLSTSLLRLGTTGKQTGEITRAFGGSGGLGDALRQVADPSLIDRMKSLSTTTAKFNLISAQTAKFGPMNDFKVAGENVKSLDVALSGLVKGGNADEAKRAFQEIAAVAAKQGVSLSELKAKFPQYASALDAASASSAAAAPNIDKVGTSARGVSVSLGSAADKAAYLGRVFTTLGGNMSVDTAMMAAAAAARALSESLKDNGKDFSLTTVKGAANRAALITVAKANMDVRDAMLKVPGGAHAANVAYEQSTKRLRDQMSQAGFTKAQIDKLVGRYQTVPRTVPTVISAIDRVSGPVTYMKRVLQGIDGKVYTVTTRLVTQRVGSTAGGITKYGSAGGEVTGGTPGVDSVPYMLKPKEFIVRDDGSNLAEANAFYAKGHGSGKAGASGSRPTSAGIGQPLVVQLALDGRIVQQVLLKVKNTNGGLALGLA